MHPCGPLLLLKHGADFAGKSENAFTAVHWLAWTGKLRVLRGLAVSGSLTFVDPTQCGNADETALQVAKRMLAEHPGDSDRREICDLLRAQGALWQSHARPLLFGLLSHSLDSISPVSDLNMVHIILSFVNGPKRPSECDEESTASHAGANHVQPQQVAAASAGVATSLFPAAFNAVLIHCRRAMAHAAYFAKMATWTLRKEMKLEEKWAAISRLLLEDAARGDDRLISLSHYVEGKGPLLMLLLGQLREMLASGSMPAAVDSDVAQLCALIRSGYDGSLAHKGRNALHVLTDSFSEMANARCYDIAEALLKCDCDVNARCDETGFTPLINWCCSSEHGPDTPLHQSIPLLLLEHGADIDARSTDGFTAVHWLAFLGKLRVLKALAARGCLTAAVLTLRNNEGKTALQIAQEQAECAQMIIEDDLDQDTGVARWGRCACPPDGKP